MERIYQTLIQGHLAHDHQMAFISGPRQVGKTNLSKQCIEQANLAKYYNWDAVEDREIILKGAQVLLAPLQLDQLNNLTPLIIFDEIHKYEAWRTWLKGLYDAHKTDINIIVTGSAKLNVLRRGGDSLMGRYFHYRIHPISLREAMQQPASPDQTINEPCKPDADLLNTLMQFGGFPEPFLKQNQRFYNKWQNLRVEQMIREDIKDLTKIHELQQLELLAAILREQAAQLVNYSKLSKKVRVTDQTIRHWLGVLDSFYFCFQLKPWTKNIARSLVKGTKLYLWDWSIVSNPGLKLENMVASHLLKAVHYWVDSGLGEFDLYYIRDKDQKEVDFLVTKNRKPWILVAVKTSSREPLSKHLALFQEQTGADYAFQVVYDLPYVDINCMSATEPVKVPLTTFLAQLV